MRNPSGFDGDVTAPAMRRPDCAPATATIVVADDDVVSRTATAARLRRLGHRVHEAGDGRAGLALIEGVRPDLAILDWMMPELDGPSVCEAVRRNVSLNACYLILLTALDQPEQLAEGLARGADDFLPKSATHHELLARIQAGLRTSRLIQDVEAAHRLLQSEVAAAGLYVRTLLPRSGQLGAGLTCAWIYRPSLALGGDLFIAEPTSDEVLWLAMLDASGHGVSAALRAAAFSTFLRQQVRLSLANSASPDTILTEAGRSFPLSEEGFYFTCWLGCWRADRGSLSYTAAGHGGALLLRRNGSIEWLTTPSLPVGFLHSGGYATAETALAVGDRLVLMSDGLYEAPSPSGILWGRDRLAAIIQEHRQDSLESFAARVVDAAEIWMGGAAFPDDVALFVCEVSGERGSP